MHPPFLLDFVIYPQQKCIANPDHNREAESDLDWDTSWTFCPADENAEDRFIAILVLESKPGEKGNAPFDIVIEAFSTCKIFNWTRMHDSEKFGTELQVRQMMMGMVREKIRLLTNDTPWGPMLIPPLLVQ